MDRDELTKLGSAACDGFGQTWISRPYGQLWGRDYTVMCGLVARGYMRFTSCHHAPISRDFVRRYEITEEGRSALRASLGVDGYEQLKDDSNA